MGNITILSETPMKPITLIGHRAGICWNADISDKHKNFKRGIDCITANHGRTFEFVDVHMIIDGYSARVIREYTRHIGGSTPWLQSSTRYIDYSDFETIRPGTIEHNKEATVAYNRTIKNIKNELVELSDLGIPREDIANLLPLGMTTKIVEKRNLRNLIDMSHVRKCSRAYWEFRELFSDIENALKEYSSEWNLVVGNMFKPKCELYGYCDETKGCGKKPKKER